ncbi:MAG: 6-phosphogluconolactonase [Actinobacteria bacterium]|nr:6-phosphogluconolactonase [Cyanobacteriota bacterium]MCL5772044.1 6-phosphogluconolactonase [Actinomycetota bacterium]
MGNFKGIVTHQTLSDEDFAKLMTMPIEEIEKWSTVGVKIVENADILYKEMARSIADVIIKNNKQNKNTKIILPVGPTPQYGILANIINTERINLENLWIFFMDEYLDWESRWVPESHPMSFRGYMNKNLFNLIDKNLGLRREQIIFPNPADLDYNENKIEELGGIDVCYGGLGYHGHIAFNEPYDTYFRRMTIEQFLNSRTRIIDLNADTFVINSLCGIGGNCYDLPPKAVTIGMKPIINAKRIEIYCDGGDLNWQLASFRLGVMHPPTLDRPGTLLQLHPNPKENVLFVADKLTARPVMVSPK